MQIRLVDVVRLGLVLCAMQVVLQAQRPEILYLRFSETAGTSTADRALPGLPGVSPTLQNGGVFNTNTSTVGGATLGPACIRTIATADPCTINTAFNVTGDWTIEFWVIDTQSNPTGQRFVFGDPTINGLRCFRDASMSNTALQLDGAGMNPVTINTALQFATWKHVAIVHDSRAQVITPYVNGVQQGQFPQPGSINLVGSGPSGLIIGGNGAGNTPWQGRLDEFRVHDRVITLSELSANRFGHVNQVNDDLAVTSIIDPLFNQINCLNLTQNTPITIEIENLGSNSVAPGTMVPVEVKVNGSTVLNDMLTTTTTLNTGDKEIITIPTGVDLTVFTAFALEVTVNFPGDGIALNDSFTRTIVAGVPPVTVFPDTEDFDGSVTNNTIQPPTSWVQPQDDASGLDSDWFFSNQPTATSGTGPTADHTTGTAGQGYFAYIEDEGNHNNVSLITKCYDFGAASNPRVKFWVWSENINGAAGLGENFLNLDVITNPGAVVSMGVTAPIGHIGTGWMPMTVDLSAFAGSTVRLVFRGGSDGGSNSHDLAIDDVIVFNFIPGIGQPPVPGQAEMDINNAESPGLSPISSLDNGPYDTTVDVGGRLNFEFFGDNNQAIILLFGSRNPVAASFTNIGNLDIGGPVDPVTGIPSAITVFADGQLPSGFNSFFNTTNTGYCNVFFTMPPFPPGVLTTFQALMLNATSPSGLTLTNAIEVTVN